MAHEINVTEETNMKPVRAIGAGLLLLLLGAVAPLYAQQDQHQQDAKAPKQEQQQAKPAEQQHQQQAQDKPAQQQQDKSQQNQQRQQQQAQGQQNQQRQQQQDKGQQNQQRQQPVFGQQNQQRQQDKNQQNQQRQRQAQDQQNQQRQQQQAHSQQNQQRQGQARDQQNQQRQADQRSQQGRNGQPGEQRAVWQEHRAHNWQSEHRDWHQRGGYNGYRIPEDRYRGYFGSDHGFRISSYRLEVVRGYPRFQYDGLWFNVVDPWPEYWSDDWYDNDDVYIVYSDDGYYLYNRSYPRDRIAISVDL
jgi:hypothetical protein